MQPKAANTLLHSQESESLLVDDSTIHEAPETVSGMHNRSVGNGKSQKQAVTLAQGCDTVFRDYFRLSVQAEHVLFQFGNRNTPKPNTISISNNIVLSVSNAVQLHQALTHGLKNLRDEMDKLNSK